MHRAITIAMLLAMGYHAAYAASDRMLTLADAIDRALANNPGQVSQHLDAAKAGMQARAARGARWPTLDFSAAVTHYGYPTFVYPVRELGKFPPLDDTLYDYGVALKLPLYTGGRLQQGVRLADLGKDISVERERLGAQELIYNVSSVYMKILHLAALDRAYAARIASLEAQEKRVALQVQVGRVPKLDHLKINGTLTKARHDRLQIENRRREADTLLYQLMGEEPPATESPLQPYSAAPAPAWTLDSLQREAGALRPELKIAENQNVAGMTRERLARGERLPSLSVIGGYREFSGADREFIDNWNLGLQLSVPLMDGGVRRARIGEAALGRAQAQQDLVRTRLEVDKQVLDAWDAQHEAGSRLEVTQTSIDEADEALAIEKLKYQQGVGVVTDLLNAESTLLGAQADRLQAGFDLIVARFNLLRATGALSKERVASLVIPDGGMTKENNTP